MLQQVYLMESDEETLRLDLKTDVNLVKQQALWAGIKPGMRIADLGCGPGKTTFSLNRLVQPEGRVVGVDISSERIDYAEKNYLDRSIEYVCRDICQPLEDLGLFDFIWVRFVLEYYRRESFEIVQNVSSLLKPGGILCLIDLDHNSLNHYGLPERFERALWGIRDRLMKNGNFDPYVGRKLYSFVYDLNFDEIRIQVAPHHLIYGELKEADAFNWTKKIEVAARRSGFQFEEYERGYSQFYEEFQRAFRDPRRFSYSPVISCRGRKPFS